VEPHSGPIYALPLRETPTSSRAAERRRSAQPPLTGALERPEQAFGGSLPGHDQAEAHDRHNPVKAPFTPPGTPADYFEVSSVCILRSKTESPLPSRWQPDRRIFLGVSSSERPGGLVEPAGAAGAWVAHHDTFCN
jgi:hypothetical protein